MTADNAFECWVNGHRVGAGDNFIRPIPWTWRRVPAGREPDRRGRDQHGDAPTRPA